MIPSFLMVGVESLLSSRIVDPWRLFIVCLGMVSSKKIISSFCPFWNGYFLFLFLLVGLFFGGWVYFFFFFFYPFLFQEVAAPCLFLMFNPSKGRQESGRPPGIQKEILQLIVDVCAKQFWTNDDLGYCLWHDSLMVVPQVTWSEGKQSWSSQYILKISVVWYS